MFMAAKVAPARSEQTVLPGKLCFSVLAVLKLLLLLDRRGQP